MTDRRPRADGPGPDRSVPPADRPLRSTDPATVHLGGPPERSAARRPDPVVPLLRAGLDRELAGLDATAAARHRLLAAAARNRSGGRSGAGFARGRWAVPVAAAAVAVTVVAAPVAAVRWLGGTGTPVPSGTVRPVQPAGPTTPSPTRAPASPSPTVRSTVLQAVLRPDVPRIPVGKTLIVSVGWVPGRAATGTPTQAAAPVPGATAVVPSVPSALPLTSTSTLPPGTSTVPTGAVDQQRRAKEKALALSRESAAAGRTTWWLVSWGDGQQDEQAVTCLGGKGLVPSRLQLQHVYRAPGAYRISVLPAAPLVCPVEVFGGQTAVVAF